MVMCSICVETIFDQGMWRIMLAVVRSSNDGKSGAIQALSAL